MITERFRVQGSGFKVHGTGLKVPAFALRVAARHAGSPPSLCELRRCTQGAKQAPSASWEAGMLGSWVNEEINNAGFAPKRDFGIIIIPVLVGLDHQ